MCVTISKLSEKLWYFHTRFTFSLARPMQPKKGEYKATLVRTAEFQTHNFLLFSHYSQCAALGSVDVTPSRASKYRDQ